MKRSKNLFRATRYASAAILGVAVLVYSAGSLVAQVVLPSSGTYQEIFVTADTTAATSTSIGAYNSFVAAEAAQSGALPSGVTWTAVASTGSVAASVNAPSGSYPVYNTNGQLVSVGNTIYGGSLTVPPGYDQFGNYPDVHVWTGSNADGTANTGNELGSSSPSYGVAHSASATWMNNTTQGTPGTTALNMYALSSPITAASAGGGIGSVGGAQVAAAGTSLGTFTSSFLDTTSTASLETFLGSAAYNAINFNFPSDPLTPPNPAYPPNPFQVWDLGLTVVPPNPFTVMVHFDPGTATASQLANLTIEHYTGGQWENLAVPPDPQTPNGPMIINTVADTITFQTDSFSPFMLAVVPEPSSLILLGMGILGFAAAAVRRRRGPRLAA